MKKKQSELWSRRPSMELWLRWSERRRHLKYKLQGDKQWAHETPEHGQHTHQETNKVQNDSDHTQREHRAQVSMWKAHQTTSRGHAQASWPSVCHDRYSLRLAQGRGCEVLQTGSSAHGLKGIWAQKQHTCNRWTRLFGMSRKQGLPGNLAKVLGQNADGEYTSVLLFPSQACHHVSQLSPRFSR